MNKIRRTIPGMSFGLSSFVLLFLASILGVGCAAAGTCSKIGEVADIGRLYAELRTPLIVAGDDVLTCTCTEVARLRGAVEKRRLAGEEEARRLAGGGEARRIGGDSEKRSIAGGNQQRMVMGETEARTLAGSSETRNLGGVNEARRIAGGAEVLVCQEEPDCAWYRVSGRGAIGVFDGKLSQRPDRCVP